MYLLKRSIYKHIRILNKKEVLQQQKIDNRLKCEKKDLFIGLEK